MREYWSPIPNDLACAKPYWNYEDIGVFLLVLVLLGSVLRLFVRFHLLPRSQLTHPSVSLQFAVVGFLGLALYLVLKLRHHQPVLRPLGWIWPHTAYIVLALLGGVSLALGVTLYLHFRSLSPPPIPVVELLVLGVGLGPTLEESVFRGCLLPVLAETTGNLAAVIVTALLFALFHQPADLAHWVWFTATGLAYGWIRVASRSTTAGAFMHATYNLALLLSARF